LGFSLIGFPRNWPETLQVRRRPLSADQYPWLLTADPPVCAVGPALGILRRCERLRRGESCFCRFAAADIADDLTAAGAPDLAELLETSLEAEEVSELLQGTEAINEAATHDDALAERLAALRRDLQRLVDAGAALTDRYSDEVD
jgi:hypothetical protein